MFHCALLFLSIQLIRCLFSRLSQIGDSKTRAHKKKRRTEQEQVCRLHSRSARLRNIQIPCAEEGLHLADTAKTEHAFSHGFRLRKGGSLH